MLISKDLSAEESLNFDENKDEHEETKGKAVWLKSCGCRQAAFRNAVRQDKQGSEQVRLYKPEEGLGSRIGHKCSANSVRFQDIGGFVVCIFLLLKF